MSPAAPICVAFAVAALAGCATGGPRCVPGPGSSTAPTWLSRAPKDKPTTLFRVGRSEQVSQTAAIEGAEKAALLQLVEQHYGQELEKDYQRVRTNIESRVVERLSSRSEGAVAGSRASEVFWERCEQADQSVVYRAAVLVEVDGAAFAKAVRKWIDSSPTVVEARGLSDRARVLLASHQRAVQRAREAVARADLTGVAALTNTLRTLESKLSESERRYRRLLGKDLPVGRWTGGDTTRLREEISRLVQSVTIGVVSRGKRATVLTEAVQASLGASGLRTETGGSCQAGWTHRLTVHAGEPSCTVVAMHDACELPLTVLLQRCTDQATLASARIAGAPTRGAATGREKALARMWTNLTGKNQPQLRAVIGAIVGRHIPMP